MLQQFVDDDGLVGACRRVPGATVFDDSDADAGTGGGGERLDVALIGPHGGAGAVAEYDLDLFVALGPIDQRLGPGEQ